MEFLPSIKVSCDYKMLLFHAVLLVVLGKLLFFSSIFVDFGDIVIVLGGIGFVLGKRL